MSIGKEAIDSYRQESLNREGWIVLYVSRLTKTLRKRHSVTPLFLYLKMPIKDPKKWSGGPLETATVFDSYGDAMQAANGIDYIRNLEEEEHRIIKVKVQTTVDLIEDLPINLLDALAEL